MRKAVHRHVAVKDKTESHQHIKIAEFRKNVRKSNPHKHNSYFEFVFLLRGSGSHTIEGRSYAVNLPVFFIILREKVHHWGHDDEQGGYVMKIGRIDVRTQAPNSTLVCRRLLEKQNQLEHRT